MMTPLEIIAKKMIHRTSEDGEMSCGHRIGDDAAAIVSALKDGGYEIVSASPPPPFTNPQAPPMTGKGLARAQAVEDHRRK